MMRSLTSCMGLVPRIFRKEKASNDLCTLRGFNFVHKYRDPNRMKYVYHDLVSGKFSCNIRYSNISSYSAHYLHFLARWKNIGSQRTAGEE